MDWVTCILRKVVCSWAAVRERNMSSLPTRGDGLVTRCSSLSALEPGNSALVSRFSPITMVWVLTCFRNCIVCQPLHAIIQPAAIVVTPFARMSARPQRHEAGACCIKSGKRMSGQTDKREKTTPPPPTELVGSGQERKNSDVVSTTRISDLSCMG